MVKIKHKQRLLNSMSAVKAFTFSGKLFHCVMHFTHSFLLKRGLKFLLQVFSVSVPDTIDALQIAFQKLLTVILMKMYVD